MFKSWRMHLLLMVCVPLLFMNGCGHGRREMPHARFVKADLERILRHGEEGNHVVISDPVDLERLLSFLPGVGEGKSSHWAGGWKTELIIVLTRKNGETVVVKSDLDVWSEGRGDWRFKPEFKTFVEDIFRKAQDQEQSGIPGT